MQLSLEVFFGKLRFQLVHFVARFCDHEQVHLCKLVCFLFLCESYFRVVVVLDFVRTVVLVNKQLYFFLLDPVHAAYRVFYE